MQVIQHKVSIELAVTLTVIKISNPSACSFQPAYSDFTLNLFELRIARHKFGLAGLRQRGGKDAGVKYFPVDVVSKNLSLMQLA